MKDGTPNRMVIITKHIYHGSPFYFRWLLFPIKLVALIIRRIVNKLRIDIWIVSGKESGTKSPLSIIYAGKGISKSYIATLALDSPYYDKHIAKTWLWRVINIANKNSNNCSLLVIEVNKNFRRLFSKDKNMFLIPAWIGGEIDISVDTSSIIRSNKSQKSVERRIKKNKLDFKLTKDQKEFEKFYYNMYLPYIKKKHGNRSFLMTYDEMKNRAKNCELLLVKKENEYIAGTLIDYETVKDTPHLWQLGVKDGNFSYVKAGAIGALYYFSIKYLKEKGYKKIHLGGSRAFLEDGVLQNKRRWGLQIEDYTKEVFLIRPLSYSTGVKGFYLRNPFICIDHKRFNGVIFVEDNILESGKEFERIYKNYFIKGLHNLSLYVFGDNIRSIGKGVPTEISSSFSIYPAQNLFKYPEIDD